MVGLPFRRTSSSWKNELTNLLKFNKRKYMFRYLEWNNSMFQYRGRTNWLGNNFA